MGVASEEGIKVKEGQIKPVSMEAWSERLKARLLYGTPSQKALICEGEAGCGKSEITAQICKDVGLPPVICPGIGAQQMEEFLAMIKVIQDESGQARVVQAVHENLIPTVELAKSGKYTIKVNGEKRTIVPWLIDEIFTGNMGQMNQLRAFLTFKQSGSVRIPPETMIIGTTNPEDVIYSSRKSVDAAVMDRVEVVRVYMEFEMHQRYLAREERDGRYPSVCRMFLRMDENRDLWKTASPRFWHIGFGGTWHELSQAEMDESMRMDLFHQCLAGHFQQIALRHKQRRAKKKVPLTAEALIGRFQNYISHGDDPHYYPISANKILVAGKSKNKGEAKAHTDLFKYWRRENQQAYIGVTVQDMTTVVCDQEDISEPQAKHIAGLLEMSGSGLSVQFFKELFAKCKDTPVYETIYQSIKGTKVFIDIADSMEQHDKMVRQIREQKARMGK